MFRFFAAAVTVVHLSRHSWWLGLFPIVAFILDRWMVWEAKKYKTVEEIPMFDKITMLLPASFIWTSLIIALVHRI
jgi:hypothetical protein